jgi:hypothetical protein
MKIDVMTSFSKEYYDHVGKHSITSWLEYWPRDIQMLAYVENCELEHNDRIKQIDIATLDEEFYGFMRDPEVKSRIKTFAKKGYSWVHAVLTSDADYLIWLDADVMTKQPITREFLEAQCDPDLLSTFMGVWYEGKRDENGNDIKFEKPLFSSETCVYFFNLKHPEAKSFARRYKEYYTKKITQNLRRFIDTDVFGACVIEFQDRAKFKDINPDNRKTPLPKTHLHPFLQHLKAGLKDMPELQDHLRSLIGDLVDQPPLNCVATNTFRVE